jgi:hypothetical protein
MNARITEILNDHEVSDAALHDAFDESLDNTTEIVRVGSLEYAPSVVLKAVDPTAYRCGFVDWLDGEGAYVEIEGSHYKREELREALEELADELNREAEAIQEELDELRQEEPENTKDYDARNRDHAAILAEAKEVEDFIWNNL